MIVVITLRLRLVLWALLIGVALPTPALSWSLWSRATDSSVCDMSPMTTYRLAQSILVPADIKGEEQIYERLALRQGVAHCANGQELILHSSRGSEFDLRYFPNVAKTLCTAADVQRIPAGTADYPQAFETRCKITKLDQAKKYLADLEAKQTTEAMIAEGIAARNAPAREAKIPGPGDDPKAKKDTICLGKFIGMPGACLEK